MVCHDVERVNAEHVSSRSTWTGCSTNDIGEQGKSQERLIRGAKEAGHEGQDLVL